MKAQPTILFFCLHLLLLLGLAAGSKVEEPRPEPKVLSFFNVVRFPNDVCAGGTRNGTCYTTEECSDRGGTASGTCADGFGVCCIISLSCGETSSENCTYLVQSSTTAPTTSDCRYTICPAGNNICRIRLDFTSFEIAAPQIQDSVAASGGAGAPATFGGGIGDCISDSFSISSQGNVGSPIICGTNTGQHLFVDASKQCSVVAFAFGAGSETRAYDIKITQYDCQSEMGGPPGCLQYFTTTSGVVASFNYPIGTSTVAGTGTSNVVHLSNQNYDMCFRRWSGYCAICFVPTIVLTAAADSVTAQSSFGLSVSPDAPTAQSNTDAACFSDYLIIPNGEATASIAIMTTAIAGAERVCGRFWDEAAAATAHVSVCTGTRPFRLTFITDADEVSTSAADNMATTNELFDNPAGIIGFSLNYVQQTC